ncbi:ABC transporter permease [Mesorhizobium comanense]|uniref:ABC transporter permease n=1 Tax=Mesorhizobium comanense TaxID=2502215 RepID=UPI0010F617B5|nr:ABC transporter permease subunit [Mesorhizobium comanense]
MLTTTERVAIVLAGAVFAFGIAVTFAPIAITLMLSIFPLQAGTPDFHAGSFDAYWALGNERDLLEALVNSIVVGGAATVISAILAIVLALYVDSRRAIGRPFLEAVIYLPFIMPPIITGLALLLFLSATHVERSLITVVVGHVVLVEAVTYRLVSTRLGNLPLSLYEASADLGASSVQTFRHIVLPQLYAPLIVGMMLSFTISFDETLLTLFLAGANTTLPLTLLAMMRVGFSMDINALVVLVIATTILIACLAAAIFRKTAMRF